MYLQHILDVGINLSIGTNNQFYIMYVHNYADSFKTGHFFDIDVQTHEIVTYQHEILSRHLDGAGLPIIYPSVVCCTLLMNVTSAMDI